MDVACAHRSSLQVQSDVDMAFATKDLSKAEEFDPAWRTDAEALCKKLGSDVDGGVGPFGLWALASGDLKERTAVFFRVFKANDSSHVVLMCNDPTRCVPCFPCSDLNP